MHSYFKIKSRNYNNNKYIYLKKKDKQNYYEPNKLNVYVNKGGSTSKNGNV